MCVVMKPAIIVVVVLFVASKTNQQTPDPDYIKKHDQIEVACAAENGVEMATIAKVWAKQTPPDDQKIKCTFKCLYTKLGVMDANGDIVDDQLQQLCLNYFNSTVDQDVMNTCKDIKDPDQCSAAYTFVECMLTAIY